MDFTISGLESPDITQFLIIEFNCNDLGYPLATSGKILSLVLTFAITQTLVLKGDTIMTDLLKENVSAHVLCTVKR